MTPLKTIKFLLQLMALILINQAGIYTMNYFGLPIPGNIAGLLFLFLLLVTKVIRVDWIEEASTYLVRHLSFFFISIAVGLMTVGSLLARKGLELGIVILVSVIVGMAASGTLSQLLTSRKEGA